MPQQSIWSSLKTKFQDRMFKYPERQEISIHCSTINDTVLFYFRLFSFWLLTSVYVWSIVVVQQSLFENVMYLTMIGYFVTWLYFILCIQDITLGRMGIKVKKMNQFVEIINEIGVCIEVPITIVFWGVLFKIVLQMQGVTTQIIVINGFLHSAPMFCLLIDFILTNFSFHINHLLIVIIFDILYMIINLSYSLQMKPVYKPINWQSIASYIIAVGCIALTILIHYIGRLTYRKWKLNKLSRRRLSQRLLDNQQRRNTNASLKSNQGYSHSYEL